MITDIRIFIREPMFAHERLEMNSALDWPATGRSRLGRVQSLPIGIGLDGSPFEDLLVVGHWGDMVF
jgi:hypothetical protein